MQMQTKCCIRRKTHYSLQREKCTQVNIRLKPSDGNEKRGKRNRAGQLPGPGKREQVPGKWEGV